MLRQLDSNLEEFNPRFDPDVTHYTGRVSFQVNRFNCWPLRLDPAGRLGISVNGEAFQTIPPFGPLSVNGLNRLAINREGKVLTWGSLPSTFAIPGAESGAISVAVTSAGFGCLVLKNDGTVVHWSGYAMPSNASSEAMAVAAGDDHFLVLRRDGRVVAWGGNGSGQSNVPQAAELGVIAVAAGTAASFALKSDGTLVAWGAIDRSVLTPAALSEVVSVSASFGGVIIRRRDGTVTEHPGNGIPNPISESFAAGKVTLSRSGYSDFVLGLSTSGGVNIWPVVYANLFSPSPVPPSHPSGYAFVATGGPQESVALRRDGRVINSGLSMGFYFPPSDFIAPTEAFPSVPLNPGANLVQLRVTGRDGLTTRTYSIQATRDSPLMDRWRQELFGNGDNTGIGADLADPDGDGITNLLEYALGNNPLLPNTLPQPQLPEFGFLSYTYTRSKDALSDGATFTVQSCVSLDKPDWNTDWQTETIENYATFQRVTVRIFVNSLPMPGNRLHVRLFVKMP